MIYSLLLYETVTGTVPLKKWLSKLSPSSRDRIYARLIRIENGNFGDFRQISPNLYELRLFFDGGLRIYYTIENKKVVILLCGGNKSSQKRDIQKAFEILLEYGKENT